MELSHDAVSRWLVEKNCRPRDIWEASKADVKSSEGVILADETVLNKSRSNKIELVRWQYSGAEHDIIRGIGMLNFIWKKENGEVCPMDFRIYEPREDGKTKNDHFRDMLKLAKKREVKPDLVIADCWYSSLDNLKCIRDLGWDWLMWLKKNRVVNRGQKLEELDIPDKGLEVHLRGYGWIYVFRFVRKNGRTEYIGTSLNNPTRKKVESYVDRRWSIETYHRELKQTCGLESCRSRAGRAQRNHIVLSVLSWIRMANIRRLKGFSLYKQQWEVIKHSIADAIRSELFYK